MACEDCTYARACPEHRRFDPKCIYCGARYLQSLKTWPPKRWIEDSSGGHEETTAERQAWRAHVLKTWTDFGHDAATLCELAAAAQIPFEPVRGRDADDQAAAADGERPERARAPHGKAPAGQKGARGRRVGAQRKASA